MSVYGDSNWNVIISDAVNTATAPPTPSGNMIYLLCPRLTIGVKFMQKIMILPNGFSIATKTGKRQQTVKLSAVFIESTPFSSEKDVYNFILSHHTLGQPPIYLFIKSDSDNYIYFYNSSNTAVNYLSGYFSSFSFNYDSSRPTTLNIDFMEAWL